MRATLASMSPRWERTAAPPPAGEAFFLDTVVRPHRSLSLTAFRVLLLGMIAINLVVGIVFWSHGAFPVTGFMGLDVLALYIAFRMNYRAAKVFERVRIEHEVIYVERREANGDSVHWVASPVWAKAVADARGVVIRSGGVLLRIAAFLSPEERVDLAQKLDDALWRAKRGY